MDYTESELLSGLISKDENILKELYVLYFQSIRRYVLTNNGTIEDAKDLFQDTLIVLFRKVQQKNFKLTCTLGTYLYSVARFLWLKELARRKWISYRPVDEEDYVDVDSDVYNVHEKNERLLLFRRSFEKLSESCRKVLSLYNQGHSIAEITGIMGFKSDQHTKNRRYRCKLSLIDLIKKEYDINKLSYGNDTND